jgi:hypothetical protein
LAVPNLTLPETGCTIAIWIAMEMTSQSPLGTPYTPAFILAVMFLILLARNVAVITTVVHAVSNID